MVAQIFIVLLLLVEHDIALGELLLSVNSNLPVCTTASLLIPRPGVHITQLQLTSPSAFNNRTFVDVKLLFSCVGQVLVPNPLILYNSLRVDTAAVRVPTSDGMTGRIPVHRTVSSGALCFIQLTTSDCFTIHMVVRATRGIPFPLSFVAPNLNNVPSRLVLNTPDSRLSLSVLDRSGLEVVPGVIASDLVAGDSVAGVLAQTSNAAAGIGGNTNTIVITWNIASDGFYAAPLELGYTYAVTNNTHINVKTAATVCSLAAVKSAQVEEFIRRLSGNTPLVWIGGSDTQTEGTWRWNRDNGVFSSPTFWGPTMPRGGNAVNYLVLDVVNGWWLDSTSDNNAVLGFVCESPCTSCGTVNIYPSCDAFTNQTECVSTLPCAWQSTTSKCCHKGRTCTCPYDFSQVNSFCRIDRSNMSPTSVISTYCSLSRNALVCSTLASLCIDADLVSVSNWLMFRSCTDAVTPLQCLDSTLSCVQTQAPLTTSPTTSPTPSPPTVQPKIFIAPVTMTSSSDVQWSAISNGNGFLVRLELPVGVLWRTNLTFDEIDGAFDCSTSNYFGFVAKRGQVLKSSSYAIVSAAGNVLQIPLGPLSTYHPDRDEVITVTPSVSWASNVQSFPQGTYFSIVVRAETYKKDGAANTGIATVGGVTGVAGLSGVAGVQTMLLFSRMECSRGEMGNVVDDAQWILTPVQFDIGTGKTKGQRGVVIGQISLIISSAVLHLIITVFVMCIWDKTYTRAAEIVWFPYIPLYVALLFLQGCTQATFFIIIQDSTISWVVAGIMIAFGYNIMFVGACIYYVFRMMDAEFILYRVKRNTLWRRYLLPSGTWLPEGPVDRYGCLFDGFIPKQKRFITYTLVYFVCLAATTSYLPPDIKACTVQYSILVVIMVIYFGICVYFRPNRYKFLNFTTPFILLCQILLVVMMLIRSNSDDPNHWSINVAAIAEKVMLCASMLSNALYLFSMLYEKCYLRSSLLAEMKAQEEDQPLAEKSVVVNRNASLRAMSIRDLQSSVVVVEGLPQHPVAAQTLIAEHTPEMVAMQMSRSDNSYQVTYGEYKEAVSAVKVLNGKTVEYEGSAYPLKATLLIENAGTFGSLTATLRGGEPGDQQQQQWQLIEASVPVIISGLDPMLTAEAISEIAGSHGIVSKVELADPGLDGLLSAKVHFATLKSAVRAAKALNGKKVKGKVVEAAMAPPTSIKAGLESPNQGYEPPVLPMTAAPPNCTVVVSNLPDWMTEADVKAQAEKHGAIHRLAFIGKNAQIEYTKPEDAQKASAELDQKMLHDGTQLSAVVEDPPPSQALDKNGSFSVRKRAARVLYDPLMRSVVFTIPDDVPRRRYVPENAGVYVSVKPKKMNGLVFAKAYFPSPEAAAKFATEKGSSVTPLDDITDRVIVFENENIHPNDLRRMCGAFGSVVDVNPLEDKLLRTVVEFTTPHEASLALSSLKGRLQGHSWRVSSMKSKDICDLLTPEDTPPANAECVVFRKLPSSCTQEEILSECEKCGPVLQCVVSAVKADNGTGGPQSTEKEATVYFSSAESANVCAKLIPQMKSKFGFNVEATRIQNNEMEIVIANLPPGTTENEVVSWIVEDSQEGRAIERNVKVRLTTNENGEPIAIVSLPKNSENITPSMNNSIKRGHVLRVHPRKSIMVPPSDLIVAPGDLKDTRSEMMLKDTVRSSGTVLATSQVSRGRVLVVMANPQQASAALSSFPDAHMVHVVALPDAVDDRDKLISLDSRIVTRVVKDRDLSALVPQGSVHRVLSQFPKSAIVKSGSQAWGVPEQRQIDTDSSSLNIQKAKRELLTDLLLLPGTLGNKAKESALRSSLAAIGPHHTLVQVDKDTVMVGMRSTLDVPRVIERLPQAEKCHAVKVPPLANDPNGFKTISKLKQLDPTIRTRKLEDGNICALIKTNNLNAIREQLPQTTVMSGAVPVWGVSAERPLVGVPDPATSVPQEPDLVLLPEPMKDVRDEIALRTRLMRSGSVVSLSKVNDENVLVCMKNAKEASQVANLEKGDRVHTVAIPINPEDGTGSSLSSRLKSIDPKIQTKVVGDTCHVLVPVNTLTAVCEAFPKADVITGPIPAWSITARGESSGGPPQHQPTAASIAPTCMLMVAGDLSDVRKDWAIRSTLRRNGNLIQLTQAGDNIILAEMSNPQQCKAAVEALPGSSQAHVISMPHSTPEEASTTVTRLKAAEPMSVIRAMTPTDIKAVVPTNSLGKMIQSFPQLALSDEKSIDFSMFVNLPTKPRRGDIPDHTLLVEGIPPHIGPDELELQFSRYGDVVGVSASKLSGKAFVQMRSPEDARRAVWGHNGMDAPHHVGLWGSQPNMSPRGGVTSLRSIIHEDQLRR